jgi:hypothetical protein
VERKKERKNLMIKAQIMILAQDKWQTETAGERERERERARERENGRRQKERTETDVAPSVEKGALISAGIHSIHS